MNKYAKVNYVKIGYREKQPSGVHKFIPIVALDRIVDGTKILSHAQFEELCNSTALALDKITDKLIYIQEMVEE